MRQFEQKFWKHIISYETKLQVFDCRCSHSLPAQESKLSMLKCTTRKQRALRSLWLHWVWRWKKLTSPPWLGLPYGQIPAFMFPFLSSNFDWLERGEYKMHQGLPYGPWSPVHYMCQRSDMSKTSCSPCKGYVAYQLLFPSTNSQKKPWEPYQTSSIFLPHRNPDHMLQSLQKQQLLLSRTECQPGLFSSAGTQTSHPSCK